jgi:DNA (cytosine-5)-methyltransferase 1
LFPCEVLEGSVPAGYDLEEPARRALDAWDEVLPVLRQSSKGRFPVYLDLFGAPDPPPGAKDWKSMLTRKNKALYAADPSAWDAWMAKYREVLAQRDTFRRLEWQAGPMGPDASVWNQYVQLRPSGIRVKKTDAFPTLVAMVQVPIYGPGKRYLTPRECARLQSFPETYILHPSDRVAYKQLGNAVNVACARAAFDSFFASK